MATSHSFIVVFPDARAGVHNDPDFSPSSSHNHPTGWEWSTSPIYPTGDELFLSHLIPDLAKRYPHLVDTSRVYLQGISNGGFFAANLAVRHPGLWRACNVFMAGWFESGMLDPRKVMEPEVGGEGKERGTGKEITIAAGSGKPSMLFIVGSEDAAMLEPSEEAVDVFKEAGWKAELRFVKDFAHR
ncbi:hypothetical protein HK102_002723 [Quaeritorhiza haematococci]|nr:hypothetical protein HK102_002723 [Quaeritorhiza haematococci]